MTGTYRFNLDLAEDDLKVLSQLQRDLELPRDRLDEAPRKIHVAAALGTTKRRDESLHLDRL